MVESLETRKRRARIELLKKKYQQQSTPKANKNIKVRQGNQKTLDVHKRLRWRLEPKFDKNMGRWEKTTVEDIHKEMVDEYEYWKEEESWMTWEEYVKSSLDTTQYISSIYNPPLTPLQKQFGRNVMPYETALLFDSSLTREEYENNPMYNGGVRLPEQENTASVYNITLNWNQNGDLQSIFDEVNDVLGINVNAFYQDMVTHGVGEVQATHLRKLIPAFLADDIYLHDGHSEYLHNTLSIFQQGNWREIGHYWGNVFNNQDVSNFDIDDIIEQTNAVQGIINKMPGLEVDTVFIRYGSLFNHEDLKVGDISNFAGFAFSSYDSKGIYESYQRKDSKNSERYKITVLAPKGSKGISTGLQIYLDMRFHTSTGNTEFIHNLNQEFIVLSIDTFNREALVLLIDDDMKKKWMNR